jgi:plastocyanin
MQGLWQSFLDLTTRFVIPDWGELIKLIPLGLLAIVALYFAWAIRGFATAGPTRRAPARLSPIAPGHIHMPGPSLAPIFVAVGAAALFWGLVVGGNAMLVGLAILALTLLYWGREAIRDYDRDRAVETLPAVIHAGPPPGVHLPGPSFRPLLGAIGATALVTGLVVGGWVLAAGVIVLVVTLTGWLVYARAEFVKTVEADRTGHLENIPPPHWPRRAFQFIAVVFALAILAQTGVFPPRSSEPAGGGGPAASAGPAADSGTPGTAFTVIAKNIAYDRTAIMVPANTPFTITFVNQDSPGVTHDADIRAADKTTLVQNQEVTNGGSQATYSYQGLPPGSYVFICSIHPIPSMTGTLTVK